MSDAIALLVQDHRSVEKLFDRFEKTGDADLALRICQELRMHAELEEQLVYPLLEDRVDSDLAGRSRHDHRTAKHLIQRIERWRVVDGGLRDIVRDLKKVVLEHLEEEEAEAFPRMEREIPERLSRLGDELAARRAVTLSQLEAEVSKLRNGVNRLSRQQRRAVLEELQSMTKAELAAYADETGIDDVDENRRRRTR